MHAAMGNLTVIVVQLSAMKREGGWVLSARCEGIEQCCGFRARCKQEVNNP